MTVVTGFKPKLKHMTDLKFVSPDPS